MTGGTRTQQTRRWQETVYSRDSQRDHRYDTKRYCIRCDEQENEASDDRRVL